MHAGDLVAYDHVVIDKFEARFHLGAGEARRVVGGKPEPA